MAAANSSTSTSPTIKLRWTAKELSRREPATWKIVAVGHALGDAIAATSLSHLYCRARSGDHLSRVNAHCRHEGEEDGEHEERRSRPWWLCGRRRMGECLYDPEERRLPRQHRPEPDDLAAGRRRGNPAHSGHAGRAGDSRRPLL